MLRLRAQSYRAQTLRPGVVKTLDAKAALLVVVQRGAVAIRANGKPFALRTPEVLVFPQPTPVTMTASTSGASVVVCHFAFGGAPAEALFSFLPAVLHVTPGKRAPSWLSSTTFFLAQEARGRLPGHRYAQSRVLELIFLMSLRTWLLSVPPERRGWLRALTDARLIAALRAIHAQPAHGWTVQRLGKVAGMSKTRFAERFRTLVGETPMQHVARWRTYVAADALISRGISIDEAAHEVGYGSHAALLRAFRRYLGTTPGAYRAARVVRR